MMTNSGRRLCGVWLGALLALAPAGAAGPGTIAVGGAFPNGYLGLLARHGLPRTVLSDNQLADPQVLARYDLVIVAGLAGQQAATIQALYDYAEHGGEVLFDYGPPLGGSMRPGGLGVDSQADSPLKVSRQSNAKLRLVGDDNPLLAARIDQIQPARLFSTGYSPELAADAKATVLAEFIATSDLQQGGPGGPDGRWGGPRRGMILDDDGNPQNGQDGPFNPQNGRPMGGQAPRDQMADEPAGPFVPENGRELFNRQRGQRQPNAAPREGPFNAENGRELRIFGGRLQRQRNGAPQEGPFNAENGLELPVFGGQNQGDRPGGRQGRGGQRQIEDTGPAAAAIVLEVRGQGRLLHCGVPIALSGVFGGVGYDGLMTSLLHLLSNGRVSPQLQAEGPELRFGETVAAYEEANGRSTTAAPVAAPVAEVTGRRRGSGQSTRVPAGYDLEEASADGDYDLVVTRDQGAVTALLGYWGANDQTSVVLDGRQVRVTALRAGQRQGAEPQTLPLATGATATLKVRGASLVVVGGGQRCEFPADVCKGAVAVKGAAGESLFQPVDQPYFTDDFMRTDEHQGGWDSSGAEWHTVATGNVEKETNPFCYKVEPKGAATALQGQWFWDDYRAEVSVQPLGDGQSLGLGVYAQDAQNLVRLEARVIQRGSPAADGWRLVRLVKGQETVLASAKGGLAVGQWYRFGLEVDGARFTALVDGEPVLRADDASFAGGRLALYSHAAEARFDDVEVVSTDLAQPALTAVHASLPRGAGAIDVNSWAGLAEPWLAASDAAGLFWRRGVFKGDVALHYQGETPPVGATLQLAVGTDGRQLDSGQRLTFARRGSTAKLTIAAGQDFADGIVPVGDTVDLTLFQRGGEAVLAVDGRELLSVGAKTTGGRVAFEATGFQPRISAFAVETAGLVDETFEEAPTRWWIGSGTWALTNRWSCSPEWSWFGGVSQDVASIWYKREVTGDQVLDFYVGPKMDEGSSRFESERVGDFNATICGDGENVKSGYAVMVNSPDGGVRLYRNGQPVAANDKYELFRATGDQILDFFRGHNRWYNVRLERLGRTVSVVIESQTVLTWDDPDPLPGGRVAIWTHDNGIMLPRIGLYL